MTIGGDYIPPPTVGNTGGTTSPDIQNPTVATGVGGVSIEAMAEFYGIDAGILEAAMLLNPWMTFGMLATYASAYASEDMATPELALAAVRRTTEYRNIFRGNVRDDGTVRYTESEYLAYQEAFRNDLSEYVNPDLFNDTFARLVENGVKYEDFKARLETIVDRIMLAGDEIRQAYLEQNPDAGPEDLGFFGDAALIAAAIDPTIGDAIFSRRITLAEITGTGRSMGFDLEYDLVERLAEQGLDIRSSQDLFKQAAMMVPVIDILAQRHNDPDTDFSIEEFLDSEVFADREQRERMRRLLAAEASLFQNTTAFATTQEGGIAGLVAR